MTATVRTNDLPAKETVFLYLLLSNYTGDAVLSGNAVTLATLSNAIKEITLHCLLTGLARSYQSKVRGKVLSLPVLVW